VDRFPRQRCRGLIEADHSELSITIAPQVFRGSAAAASLKLPTRESQLYGKALFSAAALPRPH